jgi:cytochrome c oxidase subunit III
MATTARETEKVVKSKSGFKGKGPGGNGYHKNGGNGGGGQGNDGNDQSPDRRYKLGMLVALVAILMMFVALTSAYIIRSISGDFRPFPAPALLWLSTSVLIISSISFEFARRALKRDNLGSYNRWLLITLLLGLVFLGLQAMVWSQLVSLGVYMSTNPHSSFFYILTGTHALHLLGGISGLVYLFVKSGRTDFVYTKSMKERMTLNWVVGIYWHFMDALWIYLFLLLFLWRV